MKKRLWLPAGLTIIAIVIGIVIWQTLPPKPLSGRTFYPALVNPGYQRYIQAFTSGVIPVRSQIRLVFSDEFIDSVRFSRLAEKKAFTFRPAVSGTLIRINNRTLAFQPDLPLTPGQDYLVRFDLKSLIKVPDSLAVFEFGIRGMDQDLEIDIVNHRAVSPADLSREVIFGQLLTADEANNESVEKILLAEQGGDHLPVTWTHDSQGRLHQFRIDSVRRGKRESIVEIGWSGEPINCSRTGEITVAIPPLDEFLVTGVRSVDEPESGITIAFSDPLDSKRNLAGLIRVGNSLDIRYRIDQNVLHLYPDEISGDSIRITLDGSIRNLNGKTLGAEWSEMVRAIQCAPQIRIPGNGVIIPDAEGLILPFEAVNLNAVDITVVRIFEKNILQFLQTNEMSDDNQLVQVGQVVMKKTIPLTGVVNYGIWNRYAIDLASLIRREPGAIYNIRLSMRQSYSTLSCQDSVSLNTEKDFPMTVLYDPDSLNNQNWSYYSSYQEYDWEGYDWRERNNPCKPTYYMNKSVYRNVFASDLGMIAKIGTNGLGQLFVTDLMTARPVPGATVTLFNYQQQQIGETVTDGSGLAVFNLLQKPAFAMAVQDNQTGYLKLFDGGSLSLSMFDVGGDVVQKGLKGFLFGERGVWRPGDTLFLTFILDDPDKTLPVNHPVSLSLFNPQGQLMSSMVQTSSTGNFFPFPIPTHPGDPTGNWLAKVKVGGVVFTKSLKIETVKPNRLKILLDIPDNRLRIGKMPRLELKANWLTGPVAANLKATVNLTLNRSSTSFDDYPGYSFDYPFSTFSPETSLQFSGHLDANGQASFVPDIHLTHSAPGMLKASFETMVFEEGGDFSVDRFTVPYSPFHSYAGLSVPSPGKGAYTLYTGRDYTFSLINVGENGKLLPTGQLQVDIFKLDWRWWWDDSEPDYEASFIANQSYKPVFTKSVTVSGGKASFTFSADREEWGRYLVRVTDRASGHMTGKIVYMDWEGYFRMPGGEKQAASMLIFTSDKPVYRVGEKIKLSFPSSEGGKALITLENGTQVVKSFWAETKQGNTDVTVEATKEMLPNIYAFVTLIQPYAQTSNDLPVRLYGVIPIRIEDPATHLKPQIQAPEVMVPGETATIEVRETSGRPMTYTLAIVDEGLLDLTRFKTPDPWSSFYAREALGVKSWDMFDLVLGATSGEIQRMLSIGGDEEALDRGSLKANRFVPMVRFLGVFSLKKGKTGVHQVFMPEYIGSVRIMAVAGDGEAYGDAERTAFVRKPLMVQGTLPRVLGPGETVQLPVTVFAMEKSIENVTVSVTPSSIFSVEGQSSRQITFSSPGEQVVYFTLHVADETGVGEIIIKAEGAGKASQESLSIEIRNPNTLQTSVISKAISPGASWSEAFRAVGMTGTNSGSLELSVLPPLNLEKRLGYLIRYPYGCLEQVVSAAFPQLYLEKLVNLAPQRKAGIEADLKETITRMNRFQVSGGGFALWPGGIYPNSWVTSYAGHFLLEAARKGYAVSSPVIASWKSYQHKKAVSWDINRSESDDDLSQAYRLFTLALAGEPEMSAMNKLREWSGLSDMGRWMLSAAYQQAGKNEPAMELISRASDDANRIVSSATSFGSSLRDQSLIAYVLCRMNMVTRATPLIREIAQALSGDAWYSTQTTAFALMAITAYAGGARDQTGIRATCTFKGDKPIEVSSDQQMEIVPVSALDKTVSGSVDIRNQGESVLYAQLILSGIPAAGEDQSAAHDLELSVKWLSTNGNPVQITQLKQGTTFLAEVTVRNPGLRGTYADLALNQVFPSGWEIINARMSAMAQAAATASDFTYQDVRDDRVYTFFSLNPGESKRFVIMLNASYAGRFYLPATSCEDMYDHTIYARSSGEWIEVTR